VIMPAVDAGVVEVCAVAGVVVMLGGAAVGALAAVAGREAPHAEARSPIEATNPTVREVMNTDLICTFSFGRVVEQDGGQGVLRASSARLTLAVVTAPSLDAACRKMRRQASRFGHARPALELSVERRAIETEDLGRLPLVSADRLHDTLDVSSLHLGKRHQLGRIAGGDEDVGRPIVAHVRREILDDELFESRERHGAFDAVSELANVPGPGVRE
jgi:hypothetical protein